MDKERFLKQMEFVIEVDKLKNIYRQTYVLNEDRKENDAEHSWHLALMAMFLWEYSDKQIDLLKVMKMVLIHDIVEIDAGDTYCYDKKGYEDKEDRENKAANRIFALLPDDQRDEVFQLWREFEDTNTPESKFAAALDRLQPMMLNYTKGGVSWKEHSIKYEQVISRNQPIQNGSEELWSYVKSILDECKINGML